jgi:hypothetical protein
MNQSDGCNFMASEDLHFIGDFLAFIVGVYRDLDELPVHRFDIDFDLLSHIVSLLSVKSMIIK